MKSAKKKVSKRDELLEVAIQVFARFGFEDSSTTLIAKRCKVSQAAVFYYFPTKSDLFFSVLQEIARRNNDFVDCKITIQDDGRTRLQKHFLSNLDWGIEKPEEAQVLLLAYYSACFDRRFSETYTQLLKAARNRIHGYVLAAIREQVFRTDLPTELISESLHDLLVGSFINMLTTQITSKEKSPGRLRERLLKKWELTVSSMCL